MQARIQKWGNSLAVRIPRGFAEQAGLSEGCAIDMTLDDRLIVLRAVDGPRYRLDDLLDGITPGNLHGEQDTGPAVGGEAW